VRNQNVLKTFEGKQKQALKKKGLIFEKKVKVALFSARFGNQS